MFFKGSRYANVKDAELTDERGRTIRYKRIRIITEPRPWRQHTVVQGQRLDHLAQDYYRDAERFWRICDANGALWPDELTSKPGRSIAIPSSRG